MIARKRFRALYGAGPLHLLGLLASFALAGAAVAGWFERPRDVGSVLKWFAAAIVVHDLVLLPLYSLLARIAFNSGRRQTDQAPGTRAWLVRPAPYVQVPAILSVILLAVFFPVVFGLGSQTERSASGIPESGYLVRWLLASAAMFAVSGIAYAAALARAGTLRQSAAPDRDHAKPDADSAGDPDNQTPGEDSGSELRPG